MRVALCISGHTRSWSKCFLPLYDHLIRPYSPDVFVATWGDGDGRSSLLVDRAAIRNLYQPIQATFDDRDKIRFTAYPAETEDKARLAVQPMFYLIHKANWMKCEEEKRKGFKYDVVVRLRFDLSFRSTPPLATTDSGTVYVGQYGNRPWWKVNDHFAYGRSEEMDRYASVFEVLSRHARKHGSLLPGTPEEILKAHLIDRLKIKVVKSPAEYFIERWPNAMSPRERRFFHLR